MNPRLVAPKACGRISACTALSILGHGPYRLLTLSRTYILTQEAARGRLMPQTSGLAALLIVIICFAQVGTLLSHHVPDFVKDLDPRGVGFETNSSPNFTMTIYPLSQTVRIGEQAVYQITLNSTNRFAGHVSLQTVNFPQELLKAFSPTNVTLTANKPANSTLTIYTISVGEEAFYQFAILATSGGLTQRVIASLTVLAVSAPPSIVSYTFLAGVLLFTAVIVWYGVRNRRLHKQEREEINDEPRPPPV